MFSVSEVSAWISVKCRAPVIMTEWGPIPNSNCLTDPTLPDMIFWSCIPTLEATAKVSSEKMWCLWVRSASSNILKTEDGLRKNGSLLSSLLVFCQNHRMVTSKKVLKNGVIDSDSRVAQTSLWPSCRTCKHAGHSRQLWCNAWCWMKNRRFDRVSGELWAKFAVGRGNKRITICHKCYIFGPGWFYDITVFYKPSLHWLDIHFKQRVQSLYVALRNCAGEPFNINNRIFLRHLVQQHSNHDNHLFQFRQTITYMQHEGSHRYILLLFFILEMM